MSGTRFGAFCQQWTTIRDATCIYDAVFVLINVDGIVGKKWEPGNLVPSRFSGQIRKVEARLGKLAKIRKAETD